MSFAALDQSARSVGAKLQERMKPGERALLCMLGGAEFVRAFFGCLYAGVVPVLCYPQRRRRDEGLARLEFLLRESGASAIVVDERNESDGWLSELAIRGKVTPVPLGDSEEDRSSAWRAPALRTQDLALLQYTSGSVGAPKGVMLTHGNIIANQALIAESFGHHRSTVGVSWLPLYHDMGLIGHVVQPVYLGVQSILMPSAAFLSKPGNWLRAISTYRATTSGAPNFAYQLCIDRITPDQMDGLDLSCWEVAYVGAEPVRAETLHQFSLKFAQSGFREDSLYPCYGLAEATLLVTGSRRRTRPTIITVDADALSVGRIEIRQPVPEPDARIARRH
jgi:acyl-CoA synthetase (AMP-forming)/AMP-acid ligase II